MSNADRDEVLWMLELIRHASIRHARTESNEDWSGISAAAHLCLHYVGDGCTLKDCGGLEMDHFMGFVNRHT